MELTTAMNRHPVLQDLSRDHHVMLQHAQRLTKASETSPQLALSASRNFLQYWTGAVLDHLEEEQFHAVPLVTEPGIQGRFSMVQELMRQAADKLRITLMDPQFFRAAVREAAEAMRVHVSFCEANLFADLQDNLDEKAMKKLGHDMTAFRKARRPAAIGANATENAYLA